MKLFASEKAFSMMALFLGLLSCWLMIDRAESVSSKYISLEDVMQGFQRTHFKDDPVFSNPVVYRDSNKLHVLPFSILAVVEGRYDILRVMGLFQEFSQKFPKKPYVAVIAVELPRKNLTMERNMELNGTSAMQGSLRLKRFLNFLRFKEHASIDLSYLQYAASLSAEVTHHLHHYMNRMTQLPDLIVTVGTSTTAVSAGDVAAVYGIPVCQLETHQSTRAETSYITNDRALMDSRRRKKLAADQASLIMAVGPSSQPNRKRRVVGSLLYDVIHAGLSLSIKQLTEYRQMLQLGHNDKSTGQKGQEAKFLIIGCSYSCSNMIDRSSREIFQTAIRNLASVHAEKKIYVLLDEERPEYTYHNNNESIYGSGDEERYRLVSAQFADVANIVVLDTILDYAVYVYFVLSAELYVADCDMVEGFLEEEVSSLDVRAIMLRLPPTAKKQCTALSDIARSMMIDIHPPPSRALNSVTENKNTLLIAVRDILRHPKDVGTFVSDGHASKRAACHISRFFFSQGFPSYLKKYCGNIPEELLDGSKEKSNVKTAGPRHVSVVFRDIDMKVDLSALILPIFTSEESDNNDAPLIIRHVIILYHNHIHEVLLNEEAMQSFFARNGLCCSRLSFGSYICGREVIQGTDTRSCEALTIKITLKEVDSDSLLLEFAILQSLVQSPFVVFVDRGVIAPANIVRTLVQTTAHQNVVSGLVGHILGRVSVYKSKAPISDLEVDYVQGMWCIKTEWLQSIVEALPQELSEGVQFVINVFISAILWIKYGVRTLQPALMSASLNSMVFENSAYSVVHHSRRAIDAGFVPCGVRALQPLYGGVRCCSELESQYCDDVYTALFSQNDENAIIKENDVLADWLHVAHRSM